MDLREKAGEQLSYDAVILREVERFDAPPILIAHRSVRFSRKTLLGRAKIAALIMLAPVPPEGMLFTTPFPLATEPSIWQGLLNFVHGRRVKTFAGMVDLLFSKRAGDAEVDQHAAKMVFERLWAAFEAHLPTPAVPAFVLGVPSLIIAGAEDGLISDLASVRTALHRGAEYRTEDELGHFIETRPGAPRDAEFIVDWLERKRL
jgi:pimeloyl-ACP methyl ester carboxylesterase